MLCYRDRTFCNANCKNIDCDDRLTPTIEASAERWWGKPGAPISVSDFSEQCPDYQDADFDPEE